MTNAAHIYVSKEVKMKENEAFKERIFYFFVNFRFSIGVQLERKGFSKQRLVCGLHTKLIIVLLPIIDSQKYTV